ncbi:MAG: glutathione S-transferase [Rhodospirillaceae bacterium]|nr:glutathione S-transferase [Rhodospirillaceae bacterium]|tara:strand:+ start:49312 stop:49923 length:612 start_codon:yes stop_codon:yes gene_type:complete
MQLIYHPASPYVRKVRVAAEELGLTDQIELVHVDLTIGVYNPEVGASNPIGKVPALITDDGDALHDSHVICEYLDSLSNGSRLVPEKAPKRWQVLRLHALSDEIILAGQLLRQETVVRPADQTSPEWMAMQEARINSGLDTAENLADELEAPVNLGQIALACAIDWLEFRGLAQPLRKGRGRMFDWFDDFAKRPSMAETRPVD